jgi:hypothetical protein
MMDDRVTVSVVRGTWILGPDAPHRRHDAAPGPAGGAR